MIGAADNDVRADGLAEAASLAFDGLIGGALPEPIELARDLGPLAERPAAARVERPPEEQELLETVGIAGDMPALDGADGWSFSVSNTGGNKIDAYLAAQGRLRRRRPTRPPASRRARCASS